MTPSTTATQAQRPKRQIDRAGTVLRHTVKKERPQPVSRTAMRWNAAGHDLGPVELEPTIFGLEPNRAVLHQVVTAQLAATRAGTHSTRTRAEVRGGGAKPFRQKGTGRARQGSSRSPSMSGGGIAAGPKPRSYAQHTPKKMVRLALLSALSVRAATERIAIVDDWKIEDPKTKDAATILRKLKLAGSVLVVLAQDEINVALSFRNLPQARITTHAELSAHDVLRADWLVFSDRSLPTAVSDFSVPHDRAAVQTPKGAASKAADTETPPAETAGPGEGTEPAEPAKPRKRVAKRAEAAAEPAEEAEEAGAEEGDADA
jgi:large subunit ribosomal protein L4